ncbi:MAG: stalk domain-containing protein [Candidatus Fimivivens sp.]|nr:stalk domain-containing protein [Candidatus Fimivivens sp.]
MNKQRTTAFLAGVVVLLTACGKTEKVVIEPPSASSQIAASSSEPVQQSSSQTAVSEPQQAEIKLYLNGNRLVLAQPPLLQGETVMVPVAEICEGFSREITTVSQENSLTLTDTKRGRTIVLTDKDDKAVVNGAAVNLAASATLTNSGVMLVALSDFRTLFDADNKYQSDIFAAYITESGLC